MLCRFERHCPTIVSLLIFKIKDEPLITSVLFLSTVKMNSATNTSHSFIPRAAGERTRKEEAKRLSVHSRGKGAIHIQQGIIWWHFLNKVLMQLPITPCVSSPVHFHLCLKKGSASSGVVIRTKGVKLNLRRAMAAVKLMTDCSSAGGVTDLFVVVFFQTQREPEQKSYRFHNENIFNEMAAARVYPAFSHRRTAPAVDGGCGL